MKKKISKSELIEKLYSDLHEATYEYCFHCWEYHDKLTDDKCGFRCPFQESNCFVKRWIETLKLVRESGTEIQ